MYFKYGLRNIFNFRCQITSMQFPFMGGDGMVRAIWWGTSSIPTNTNIEQMYVYASEWSVANYRTILAFSILGRLHWSISFNILSVQMVMHWSDLHVLTNFQIVPTNTNIEQMYVDTCRGPDGANLRAIRKSWDWFTYLKTDYFLSIFCRRTAVYFSRYKLALLVPCLHVPTNFLIYRSNTNIPEWWFTSKLKNKFGKQGYSTRIVCL